VSGIATGWTRVLAIAACLAAVTASRADEIEGVSFPVRLERADGAWQLHGMGLLRYKVLIKGYVAALYTQGEIASDAILGDVPRRLEISYFWSIPARDFARATEAGIARNVDATTLEKLRPGIDRINALYEDVSPGDRYSLTYLPGEGTELALNGRAVGRVEGAELSAALFAIWLGDDPLSEDLRDQLLDRR